MFTRICKTLPFCDRGEGLISDIGHAVAMTLLPILAGVAVASIAYAGVKMVQSNGDESGLADAKKIIITTIIGAFIALSSVGIITLLKSLIDKAT